MATTEVAPFQASELADFALFQNENLSLNELMEDNLGDDQLRPNDLPRIKVPTGGGTTFEIPTIDGDMETKEIEAVIIKITPIRIFWKEPFGSGESAPPDCLSNDLLTGVGEPSGKCADCPYNQIGSAKQINPQANDKAKACTEKRNIFILPPNALLPYNLSCPVMSIGNLKEYKIRASQKGLSVMKMSTLISLTKDKNEAGIQYARLTFKPGRKLAPEQVQLVQSYRQAFSTVLETVEMSNRNEGPAPDFS